MVTSLVEAIIFAVSFGLVGLLVVYLLRFGPVENSWVKLSKAQVAELKAAHKRYVGSRPRSRPTGPPLYKRRMVSHEGIAVYADGILAKFCVGKTGRYRFVPFAEISGIYPVHIDNPLSRRDSRWTGLSSWKGLQIETESSMAYLVSSLRHDLEVLVPVLKRAMGERWDRVYHPDEQIWTNFLEGFALVPRPMRGAAAAPAATPPPMTFGGPKVAPAAEARGKLLLEEGPEDLRERARSFVKAGVVLIAVAAVSLGIGLALQTLHIRTNLFSLTFLLFLPFLIALLCFPLGGAVLQASRKPKPIRVYDGGFELPTLVGGRTLFFSFGEIAGVRESHNFLEGETYVFRTTGPNRMFSLRKRTRGLPELMETLRPRFGRPEYYVRPEPTKAESAASRKVEYAMYTMAVVAGVVGSVAFCMYTFAGLAPDVLFYAIGLVLPPMTIFAITFVTFRLRTMDKVVPRRLNVKVPAAVIVVLLVYFFASAGVGFLPSAAPGGYRVNIGPQPASSALAPGVYENTTLNVTGPVLVDAGQTTVIRNATVVMRLPSNGAFGFWIAPGGTLVLENASLRSEPSSSGYTFEVMGTARIAGSTLAGLWGDPQHENFDGGLELYSSDVVVDRTWITGAATNGILIEDAAPVISNSTIELAGDDGIEMHNSSATIVDSVVDRCDWAMVIGDASTPTIARNLIHDNSHGIAVASSDPVITFNTFDSNRAYAVQYDDASHPVLQGNVYTLNEAAVVGGGEDPLLLEICGFSTVAIAVVGLLVLFWVYKEGLRKEMESRSPAPGAPRPPP